ncbi:hypothetical protein [Phenylobacterium soli]|uniref:Quinohemoprotein amine dehydrogenase alpha subunit haem binding domain-containing protein n=1 Tax=Phenylobacterium soli TaxID=2170551 RepID=A0A328AB52_9CAUL|nr:hypothetical protein [Phenylobacterium soli]RAK51805.1 hypothetical protein DJ017_18465 [Phenylobacterium soli]
MLRSALVLASAAALLGFAGAAAAAGPNDLLPEDGAKALVVRACTSCHQAPQIVAKRHSPEEWDEIVGKMVDRGARATEAEQAQISDYLAKHFGPNGAAKPGK